MTHEAIDAMVAALAEVFTIYSDPHAGTDIDSDAMALLDALRDEGYVLVKDEAH